MSADRFLHRRHASSVATVALMILAAGCAEQQDEKIIRMGYVSGPTVLLHADPGPVSGTGD